MALEVPAALEPAALEGPAALELAAPCDPSPTRPTSLTGALDLTHLSTRRQKVIVFCCPHEFAHQLCNKLQGHVRKDAIAISLTKGMRIRPEGPQLISEMVRRKLGIDCSVLMGANIAGEIGAGETSSPLGGGDGSRRR